MKLISADFENIGVLEKLHLEFKDGLTALMGPQGSGKTTIVNSIYAAVTNDFSRVADGKQDIASQQAVGKPSSIAVELECGGSPLSIFRGIVPASKNRLRLPDGNTLTKDAEIRSAMAEILDASRALLDNYVFVDQWSVRNLFQSTASQRAENFSHLCGTRFLGPCHDLVSKQKESDLLLLTEGAENTDRLRQELTEYKELLAKEKSTLVYLQETILDSNTEAKYRQALKDYTKIGDISRKTVDLQRTLETMAEDRIAVKRSVKTLKNSLSEAEYNEESLRAKTEAARTEHALYEGECRFWEIKTGLQSDLSTRKTALLLQEPTTCVADTVEKIKSCMERVSNEMAPYRAIINKYDDLGQASGNCPTCGHAIDDVKQKLAEAHQKFRPLANEYHDLREMLELRRIDDDNIKAFVQNQEKLKAEVAEIEAKLESMKNVSEPKVPAIDMQNLSDLHTKAIAKVRDLRKHFNAEVEKSTKLNTQYDMLETNLVDLQAERLKITVTSGDMAIAHEALELHDANKLKAAGCQAKCDEFQRVIDARITSIKEAEEKQAQNKQIQAWINLLNRALPILHRDGLAKEIHNRAMRRLEGAINATLEEFESPFRISTGEDLAYMATFPNKTKVPAHRLSGGQQVVLSLAMRWALNSLFANQIGLLVLDEPTAGLDERHLGLLESTLSKLGAAAKNRGCQVIIITHERRLRGVFDQVIELERPVL